MALSRLANTEKRLLKGIELVKRYNEIIAQYFEKGFLEPVDKKEKKNGWFLQHFLVLQPNKSAAIVRIVFD